MRFANADRRGHIFGVFMTKAAWDIGDDGLCRLSEEQEPFTLTDGYHGDLNVTALRQPSDFVPYKPKADIIPDAVAYAPGGSPQATWIAGLRVADGSGRTIEKNLRITGPRWWVPQWRRQLKDEEKRDWKRFRHLFVGWKLSEPEPISYLPIRYEYAYGGCLKVLDETGGQENRKAYHHNPIGMGWIDKELTDHTERVAAPQIEDPDEPISDPYMQYLPHSLGPIPPAWLPRRPLGGTYDQNWLDNVRPRWPEDYDFAYNNSASLGLISEEFLQGEISFELHNLHPKHEHWTIKLPDKLLAAILGRSDGRNEIVKLAMDTVFLDIGQDCAGDYRILTTWRAPFNRDGVEMISLRQVDPSELKSFSVPINASPHPETVAQARNKEAAI